MTDNQAYPGDRGDHDGRNLGTQLGRKRIPTAAEILDDLPATGEPEHEPEQVTDTIVVPVITNAQVALLAASNTSFPRETMGSTRLRAKEFLVWLDMRDEEAAR